MAPRNREAKAYVSTSFPDLLGDEGKWTKRENYPSEVTIGRASGDDSEADGLLDELLNDDDTLTNSCGDRTHESNYSELEMGKPKLEKPASDSTSFIGGLLSFSAPPPTPAKKVSTGSTKTPAAKRVTYADEVKVVESPTDDTSKTDSEKSSARYEEEEEAIEIVSVEEEEEQKQQHEQAGQEVELLEDDKEVWNNEYNEEEEGEEEGDEGNEDESVDSSDSNTTQDLLERAHDRLNMQGLYEEVSQLRKIIERKDKEIEELSGQLRRAVATKCDLVIAHTELERHHEFNLKQLEEASRQLLKANFGLVEEQADTDVQLMNEIVRLNQEKKEMKSLHIQELGDWERLHTNEMREMEFEIAKLKEEIRKITVGTTHGRKQKKLLGLARQ